MSTANATQVGGQHYKVKTIQPWDFIAANGLGYFEGNIVKYVTRWRAKVAWMTCARPGTTWTN